MTSAGAPRSAPGRHRCCGRFFRLERLALVIDGDHHADRWRMTGTQRGELFGMPPTGRPVAVEGATFTRLGADGLVIEDVHFLDLPGVMAQLH